MSNGPLASGPGTHMGRSAGAIAKDAKFGVPGRAHFVPAADNPGEGRDDASASVYGKPRWLELPVDEE